MTSIKSCFIVFVAVYCSLASAVKLGSYNVDKDSVTVSGLSSGGAMAMQFHIAFSNKVHASGIFAGLPFACAKGGLTSATMCMSSPGTLNVNTLIAEINNLGSAGSIDSPNNLEGDNVFIFHGTKDTTVNPVAAQKTQQVYDHFGVKIRTEYTYAAVHGFPTDFYGAACGSSSALTQYINNCAYHGAYDALNYLYNGTLVKPTGSETLQAVIQYEQTEFGASAATSMDSIGYAYVPSKCADKSRKCKFHISLHGCQQHRSAINDVYATKTGYLQVAEANDIIVIFPQATANMLAGNPNGCWDWWGYLNINYLNRNGAQMKAIGSMMERVAFCDGAPNCNEDEVTTTTQAPVTAPTTTEASTGPTTTRAPGQCKDNEVSFSPFPSDCTYYTMCACGVNVLLQCAPGLYFDVSINSCNFIQLVNCENGVRP